MNQLTKNQEIIVFLGLTDFYESEAGDREHMQLPSNQLELIMQMIKHGFKPTIVLFGGSPVELPFVNQVDAILLMHLAGQGIGEATARLLFGEVNPSGKLAETWPKTYQDVPFGKTYGKSINEIYKESIFVGYRYYGSKSIKP